MTIPRAGTEHHNEVSSKTRLLNADKRISSRYGKSAVADATACNTRPVDDGNRFYILNGREVFSSSLASPTCAGDGQTYPNAPRHKQFRLQSSNCRTNPGYRSSSTSRMASRGPHSDVSTAVIPNLIKDLKIPAEQPARGEGQRLSYGASPPRVRQSSPRHHNVARPSARIDMAVAHVTKRSTSVPARRPARRFSSCSPNAPGQLYMGGYCCCTSPTRRIKGMEPDQ